MVDISQFEQYFPNMGCWIEEEIYKFKISLNEEEGFFNINLKIRQKDTKEENLIKIRAGMGKHDDPTARVHNSKIPHFEINYYDRTEESFFVTLYFEFEIGISYIAVIF